MRMNSREQVVGELAAATEDAGRADARLRAARAVDDVTSHPGLRYARLDDAGSVYVVACDGVVLGRSWPGPGGTLLAGWTCAPLDDQGERLGPFRTGRAAAAALAAACGVTPRHVLPADRT